MGKRSDFERRDRDFYATPYKAVVPLLNHLDEGMSFMEPCAGDGALVRHIEDELLPCVWASDIEPASDPAEGLIHIAIKQLCFRSVPPNAALGADVVITNPPWQFPLISDLLYTARCKWKRPIWLLLPGDFAHNKQSSDAMRYCERVVPIGRVKWIPGSKHAGKDNCAWYLFNPLPVVQTTFFPRIVDILV